MLWTKRHEPEAFERVAHVLLPNSYVNYHLTGRFCIEVGTAHPFPLLATGVEFPGL